jgi:succinate dehydrogenase / fumarate reductase membrane anchor subunit
MSAPRTPQFVSPARKVRGLGAAHTGTGHFIAQRVTSVALVFLSIAFVVIAVALIGRNHAEVVQILGSPIIAVLMLLFVGATIYHMWIGMQEIIIDYVHDDVPKFGALMGNAFFCIAVVVACSYALFKLSFGV